MKLNQKTTVKHRQNLRTSLNNVPGCGEDFLITAIRLSNFVCSIFMALLASESWIMLQIKLHAIILSYGLAQDGEDLSPFTVNTRDIAIKQAWKDKRMLTICR